MLELTSCSLLHVKEFQQQQIQPNGATVSAVVLCEHALRQSIVDVCAELRREDHELVVIAVPESSDADLEWRLLTLGVDDVVGPPVMIPVLVARFLMRIRQRGWPVRAQDFVDLNGVLVDFVNLSVLNHGIHRSMSCIRAKLLRYLLANPNRVVSREEAYERVWDDAIVDTEGKCLDIHISKLRRIVERDPKHPTLITTVRGRGYQLNLPPDHPAIERAPWPSAKIPELPSLVQIQA